MLLVVDDPDLQSRLARRFSRSGHRVVGAPSYEAAHAVCSMWCPDLVLLDETVRGGHSGLEVARDLRRVHPRLRAVILGSNDGSYERVDAIVAAAGTMLAEVAAAVAREHPGRRAADSVPAVATAASAADAPGAVAAVAVAVPARVVTSSGSAGRSGRPSRSSARRR